LFATSLQAAGVDPIVRRDVMGHTTLAMTARRIVRPLTGTGQPVRGNVENALADYLLLKRPNRGLLTQKRHNVPARSLN
jgi:hypothetical protein